MPDGQTTEIQAIAKNAPDGADDPAAARGAMLSAHAGALDSRLRAATQSDRQTTRRAAAHVVQLARRIARLLPRVPTLLPVLPGASRDTRVRHYVLQARPAVGSAGTRMLTLSTQTVLRHAEFDGTGKPTVWSEYNPLEPAAGWELEIVLERLAEVLAQITDQVERLEARVVERAKTLNSLVNSSPLTNRSFGAPEPDSATAIDDGMLDSASADETLSDLALLDLVMGAPPANYDDLLASLTQGDYLEPELPPMLLLEAPVAEPFVALPPMIAVETAVERERREHRLFRHLRGR